MQGGAARCATESIDHLGYLLQLCELELVDRERRNEFWKYIVSQHPNAAKLHSGSAHDPPAFFEPGAGANEANLHLGSGATYYGEPTIQAESNGAKLHTRSAVQLCTRSLCWPHREVIQSKLDQGLTAQRIHQGLRTEQGFTGSYFSVFRFVQRLQPRQESPFRRMVIDNLKAGVLQADWYDPELNPKLEAIAHHHGTVILPTKPRAS